MEPFDKILILHHGALGDLLCARPALFALARCFRAMPRYALVRPETEIFLRPLGYAPCPEALRAVEDAFHGGPLPAAADGCRIFRFCLDKAPQSVPASASCLFALPEEETAVAQTLLEQAARSLCASLPAARGKILREFALKAERREFQRAFGAWAGQGARRIGLFPGSGHPAKNWPARNFEMLALALARRDYAPIQILGPVEAARETRLADVPAVLPGDMRELIKTLIKLRLVIGNDSGPLHLAARLGVPCVALFGPGPAGRWGPPGALCLQSPLPCAPCSGSLRSLACSRPLCMEAIEVERVLDALEGIASFRLQEG